MQKGLTACTDGFTLHWSLRTKIEGSKMKTMKSALLLTVVCLMGCSDGKLQSVDAKVGKLLLFSPIERVATLSVIVVDNDDSSQFWDANSFNGLEISVNTTAGVDRSATLSYIVGNNNVNLCDGARGVTTRDSDSVSFDFSCGSGLRAIGAILRHR